MGIQKLVYDPVKLREKREKERMERSLRYIDSLKKVKKERKAPVRGPFSKNELETLYIKRGLSMKEIAEYYSCSKHKVIYWMTAHNIQVRSQSEATYVKRNKGGDPFLVNHPETNNASFLFGLGIGLYWGEGTKVGNSIRLGNSDPGVIIQFINFLEKIYGIKKEALKFGLQIFGDLDEREILRFWCKSLGVPKEQFQKPVVTKLRGRGTYKRKSEHGVVTIYFHNSKLKKILMEEIEKLK
ncbi:hypothetical protein C4565_10905 [Candidatus Parcubacteria bacterium]|jgi:hypothetical protein|nr:MAG: hypothetical protein C4565_10905 [Candidatus Parcubacteria bacterium]